MYDGIFEDVEHVKRVLEAGGHHLVDGTLVFELLEDLRDADAVVKILLGRRIKRNKNKEKTSHLIDSIGELSSSSDDLEVILDDISAKTVASKGVDLTVDDIDQPLISGKETTRANDNKSETVLCTSSSNSIEPLLDLTNGISSTMEVDENCCGNSWSQPIETKTDLADLNNSATESESEMDDYYRRPPSVESHDSEVYDDKVSLPPSPLIRLSANLYNQDNNEVSVLETGENRWGEMLEENNNDPNNNLEDIEVLEQNNASSTTTENRNTDREIVEERIDSPKPGCSKDSYYTDNDICAPENNDDDLVTPCDKGERFDVQNSPDAANLIDCGYVVVTDDAAINDNKIEQEVTMIQKLLPHIEKSAILSAVVKNKEAINRVEIALWELLPEDKPAPIFQPKRKQSVDNCPAPVKKFLQDNSKEDTNVAKPLTVKIINRKETKQSHNVVIEPARLLGSNNATKAILKPPKLITKNSQPVSHPVKSSIRTYASCTKDKPLLKPSRLTYLTMNSKKNHNYSNKPAHYSAALNGGSGANNDAVPLLDANKTRAIAKDLERMKQILIPTKVQKLNQVSSVAKCFESFKEVSDGDEPQSSTITNTVSIDLPKQPQFQYMGKSSTKRKVETTTSSQQNIIVIPKNPQKLENRDWRDAVAPTKQPQQVAAPVLQSVKVETKKTSTIPQYPANAQANVANRNNDAKDLAAAADTTQNKTKARILVPATLNIPDNAAAQIRRRVDDLILENDAAIEQLRNIEDILRPKQNEVPIGVAEGGWEQPFAVVKTEKLELPPNELYNPLLSMFPDVDPNYIAQLCISAKMQNQALDTLVEILLVNGVSQPRICNPEPEPLDINPDSQYENLQGIFPDAEREYLRHMAELYYNDTEAMKNFVQAKLENPDYPKMADYLKRIKITEQIKQYTEDFSAEKFLQIFPDPFAHFESTKRVYRYNVIANEFLKSHFRSHKVATIIKAYRYSKYPHHLSLAAKILETTGPDMKTRRSDKPLPTEDIPLLQEFAFIKHKAEIKEFMNAQKKREKQEFKKLKANNELLECQCCFDTECMPSKCLTCNESHIFCIACITTGAASKIGEGQTRIPCFADCQGEFTLEVLQKVLEPTMFSILLRKRQEEEVKAAGLEGLVACPFCHFASIPPPEDKVFKCLNPECMKESCRMCKELNHVPLRCDEVVKREEARHYLEEKMTEALVRKCYRCSRPFFKDEGCNKMTCPCGAMTCYICGEPVKDYQHFNGQGSGRTDLCPLWSDNNVLNAKTVRVVAEAAEKEMLKKNPNLKLDTKTLLPAIPKASRGPHEDIANGHVLPVRARRV